MQWKKLSRDQENDFNRSMWIVINGFTLHLRRKKILKSSRQERWKSGKSFSHVSRWEKAYKDYVSKYHATHLTIQKKAVLYLNAAHKNTTPVTSIFGGTSWCPKELLRCAIYTQAMNKAGQDDSDKQATFMRWDNTSWNKSYKSLMVKICLNGAVRWKNLCWDLLPKKTWPNLQLTETGITASIPLQ